jgi:hypothetical protein
MNALDKRLSFRLTGNETVVVASAKAVAIIDETSVLKSSRLSPSDNNREEQ